MKTALLLLFSAACAQAPPPPNLEGLDVAYFQCNVQPIFDRSCAFPKCHGNPGRPLFLYSASKTRIELDTLLGEPLTSKEICANYYRAAAFARTDYESQLITKPSTLDALSSQYHEGNYLFGPGDPQADCLEQWMEGAAQVGTDPSCMLFWRIDEMGTPERCDLSQVVDCSDAARGANP